MSENELEEFVNRTIDGEDEQTTLNEDDFTDLVEGGVVENVVYD